jgi:hypothetical protein
MHTKYYSENVTEETTWRDIGLDGRIILNWILEKSGVDWTEDSDQ